MAITFLGYIDTPDEMLTGKRRMFLGLDTADDVENLPTSAGITLKNKSKTSIPAAWSRADVITTGKTYILNSQLSWVEQGSMTDSEG